ncbi:MAG: DUF1993 domain-containing protein [Betaproteobacteria bacterium]|nr:DUF1993 domain-containing protein [Betaproteobacteria bacterium]
MSLSMYQASVPALQKTLGNLKDILKKGEDFAKSKKIDESVLLNFRLAPDMFALTRQVQIACDVAKGMCCRLSGSEIPSYEDKEASFTELYARIDRTLALIATFKPEQIDSQEEREIVITPGGRELRFKGQMYLVNWAMPNFYFHVMTTYLILRHNGVDVGKMDYLGSF